MTDKTKGGGVEGGGNVLWVTLQNQFVLYQQCYRFLISPLPDFDCTPERLRLSSLSISRTGEQKRSGEANKAAALISSSSHFAAKITANIKEKHAS